MKKVLKLCCLGVSAGADAILKGKRRKDLRNNTREGEDSDRRLS